MRICTSASPNGVSSGAAPSSHAAATPIQSSVHIWSTRLRSPGADDEAMAAATGLIDAAEATHNPGVLSLALYVQDSFTPTTTPPSATPIPSPRWTPCAGAW